MQLKTLAGLFLLFLSCSFSIVAGELSTIVNTLELQALEETFSDSKVSRLLEGEGKQLPVSERRSAAVLISIGILSSEDLSDADRISEKSKRFEYSKLGKNKHFVGPFNAPVTQARLNDLGGHDRLLEETTFINSLHSILSGGTITGYDLRAAHISSAFDPDNTLIYSHSSILHIKQLTALLSSEGIEGLLYVMPKISAFLFRDAWGEPPKNVSKLADGRLVVNGREWVVFFEFQQAEDKHKFHQLVTKYAKKDEANEPGLITDSWWQPFYYSGLKMQEFEHINLILLRSESTEATLTVLPENLELVESALSRQSREIEITDIWVNRPFYRFLGGGYK